MMTDVLTTTIDESQLDTIMGADVEFEGILEVKHSLMIKGKMKGTIKSQSSLYIDAKANVEADITAPSVSIKGRVKGNIVARDSVELFASASVEGDVTAPKVTMEPGSFLHGACKMQNKAED